MTNDPRLHIDRRDGALVRLRGLTTTAAVAGVAGTAVFGVVAAASWSGQPGVTSAAQVNAGTAQGNDNATQPQTDPQAAPQTNPFFQTNPYSGSSGSSGQATNPGSTRIRSSYGGRSHATTGGSG
jgi:hypothetical protein